MVDPVLTMASLDQQQGNYIASDTSILCLELDPSLLQHGGFSYGLRLSPDLAFDTVKHVHGHPYSCHVKQLSDWIMSSIRNLQFGAYKGSSTGSTALPTPSSPQL
jgi:hypothetical protein